MSMTRNLFGLALVAVAGTAVSADPVTFDSSTDAFKAQVTGQRTVQAQGVKTTTGRETAEWAYNTRDCADCYWGYNFGWSDPECFVDGGANCPGYIWILPMGYTDFGDVLPYGAPQFDDGAGNVWATDIFFDDYQSDAGVWGDTGMLHGLAAFTGNAWTFNNYGSGVDKTFVFRYLWISADGATFYGGYVWELSALQGENWLYNLIAGELDAPTDPPDFEFPYEGLICFDYDNVTVEGHDDGGAWNVFLGGDIVDVAFPYPTDLYELGYNDETFWAAGGIDDPNVDPNWDGDPELGYLDILNTGYLINWAFTGTNSELAHGTPTQMGIIGGGVEPCDGDLDGDGDTDQSDLGILLAAFGVNANGDLNGDGVTDQSDLGILLADFGCVPG